MPKEIKVNPDTFRRFMRARAGASAANRRAEQLKAQLGLPDASKKTAGEYVLTDGNNNAVGKLTISPRDGFTVKPGWTGRIS